MIGFISPVACGHTLGLGTISKLQKYWFFVLYMHKHLLWGNLHHLKYRTCANTARGLYFFKPPFWIVFYMRAGCNWERAIL